MTIKQAFHMDKIAMALQWVVYEVMPETPHAGIGSPDNTALQLGRLVASNVLLPLTVELALKGLCQRTRQDAEYERVHDSRALIP